jgi:hypothetical protein
MMIHANGSPAHNGAATVPPCSTPCPGRFSTLGCLDTVLEPGAEAETYETLGTPRNPSPVEGRAVVEVLCRRVGSGFRLFLPQPPKKEEPEDEEDEEDAELITVALER